MPNTIFEAKVKVPEYPRARFMRNAPPGTVPAFIDVTRNVVSVLIEKPSDGTDSYGLVRLDEKNELVWRTIHHSEEECRWQVKHEYQLEEKDWTACPS